MAWTKKQRAVAAMAAKAADLCDADRRNILRQLANSKFDENGQPTGEPSSKSSRLDQTDFEWFMATCEARRCDHLPGYDVNHWQSRCKDELGRFRKLIERISNTLELEGYLNKCGAGLRGWIRTRITQGRTDQLMDLDYHELRALHDGLMRYGRSKGLFKHAS